MSQAAPVTKPKVWIFPYRAFVLRLTLATVVVVGALVIFAGPEVIGRWAQQLLHTRALHTPNFAPLARTSPLILAHLSAALTALLIGIVLLIGVKGTTTHQALGYAWVTCMAATAASSLFIKEINPGHWSYIHFLSGWTIITLPLGVAFARRKSVRRHARTMTSIFVGGLVVAGLFTFLPGRLMWQVFLR